MSPEQPEAIPAADQPQAEAGAEERRPGFDTYESRERELRERTEVRLKELEEWRGKFVEFLQETRLSAKEVSVLQGATTWALHDLNYPTDVEKLRDGYDVKVIGEFGRAAEGQISQTRGITFLTIPEHLRSGFPTELMAVVATYQEKIAAVYREFDAQREALRRETLRGSAAELGGL